MIREAPDAQLRTRHVAVATAGVAGLASTASETSTAAAVGVTEAGLGAVTGNVADLAALFKLSAKFLSRRERGEANLVALGGATHATTRSTAHGAVAGDVAGLTALVARLVVLHRLVAVTACVVLVLGPWHREAIPTHSCGPRLKQDVSNFTSQEKIIM